MKEQKFEKLKTLLVINEDETSTKEINLIKWFEREPKIDIRNWYDDIRMSKGITLTVSELEFILDNKENLLKELEEIKKTNIYE